MKKVYLFSMSMFAVGVLSAQYAPDLDNLPLLPTLNDQAFNEARPTHNQNRAGGDDFYVNTFDDENDWTLVNDGAQGTWEYGGPTDAALAPNYMSDIESTTKADGYYFFDGVQYLVGGNVNTQESYIQNAVAINCSGRDGVLLTLEQSYRAFNDDVMTIQVSNDETTWTDYVVNDNVATNTGTMDDIFLNISDVAANQLTVYIRFLWTGNAGGYGWIIDDLTLTESHTNDIVQQDMYLADINTGYEYTMIPQSQAGILTVQSALLNAGVATPADVVNHVIVMDATSTEVYNGTGGTLSGALAQGDYDTLTYETTLDMSTLAVGVYEVTNIIEYTGTDDDPTNDTLRMSIEITENVYSHFDMNSQDTWLNNPGRNNTDTYDQFSFGSTFEITADQDLHGVDFYLTSSSSSSNLPTTNDNDISVTVWEWTGPGFQDVSYINEYAFAVSELGMNSWNTLNFTHPAESSSDQGPVTLEAGKSYRVMVGCEGGNVLWGLSTRPDTDYSSQQISDNGQWYSLQEELGISLNFDESLNVEDESELTTVAVAQNVPNPFTASTVINYNLTEASNVSIQVVDVTGKVVSTINEGTQTAGAHNVSIDGTDLAAGTYFYTFTAGTYQVTKRMVVSK